MSSIAQSYIAIDDRGRAVIDGTGARVALVAIEMNKGASPAEIHAGYPHLTMSQIHAALAYYYDHQTEIDLEIQQGLLHADRLRDEAIASGNQPARAELERRHQQRGRLA